MLAPTNRPLLIIVRPEFCRIEYKFAEVTVMTHERVRYPIHRFEVREPGAEICPYRMVLSPTISDRGPESGTLGHSFDAVSAQHTSVAPLGIKGCLRRNA
jgi:hypothetical protein